ncbi:tetratricopeptide repeat protein [Desulfovibrio aminophilus]|uniref:tetratricopeptide repeat protein n=1 Tax=Desulfovibrio aminophilus TaxID=81425 RepID=UPI0003FB7A35|nr:tetratricopeptide repeat protein [Desulfovibrio aminophilus]
MNKKTVIMVALAATLAMTGCATMRQTYNAQVRGPWYMNQGKYKEGIAEFDRELREHPGEPGTAYWLGRYHLALNEPGEAVSSLEQAVRQDPGDADAHFWLGVGYWALGDQDRERSQYEQALRLEPKHLAANLYLAHNLLDRGQWAEAAAQYDKVLRLAPEQPEALYDRALALDEMHRTDEARRAWKTFLDLHPEGGMALAATDRLNARGGFEYRNVYVGQRRTTIKAVEFDSKGRVSADSLPSLEMLAAMLSNRRDIVLHIVTYAEGKPALAKARAQAVRKELLAAGDGLDAGRLPLSWFGSAEKVAAGGKTWRVRQSVNFVTQVR